MKSGYGALYITDFTYLEYIQDVCNVVEDSLDQNPFFKSFFQQKETSNPVVFGVAENRIR